MERNSPHVMGPLISFLFVISLFAAALSGRLLAATVENRITDLRTQLLGNVESTLGQDISWQFVSPSVLRGFTFTGVRVSGDILSARTVSVSLQLRALLFGDPRELIPEVTVGQPEIHIRSQQELDSLIKTIQVFQEGEGADPVTRIRITDGTVTVMIPEQDIDIRLEGLSGLLNLDHSGLTVDMFAAVEFWTTTGGQPFALQSGVTINGEGSRDLDQLGINVDLSGINGSHLSVKDQTVRLTRDGDDLTVERIRSQDALDVLATAAISTGSLTVILRSENLRPDSLVTLRGPWGEYQRWLQERISSSGTFHFDLETGFLSGEGRVAGRFSDEVIPEPVDLTIAFTADRTALAVSSLSVRPTVGTGVARVSGSWQYADTVPAATVVFERFRYHTFPELDGSIQTAGDPVTAQFASEGISVNSFPLYDFAGSISLQGAYSTIRISANLEEEASSVGGIIRFAGFDDFTGEVQLGDVSVRQGVALGAATGLDLDFPPRIEAFRVDGSIRFDYRDGNAVVRIPFLSVSDETDPLTTGTISATYRNGAITLSHLVANTAGVSIVASAEGILYRDNSVEFSTALRINGLPYSATGHYRSDRSLELQVDESLFLTIVPTRGGFRISGETRRLMVPVAEVSLTSTLEGLFLNPREWYLNISDAALSGLQLSPTNSASVIFAAAIEPERLRFAITEFSDRYSTLAGTGDLQFDLEDGIPDLRLNSQIRALEGPEQYRIAARYAENYIALDVRFAEAPAARVIPAATRGTIGGTLQIAGNPTEPEMRLDISSSRLALNDEDARIQGFASLDADLIVVREANLALGANRIASEEISIDRRSGDIRGSLSFTRAELLEPLAVSFSGTTDPIASLSADVLKSFPIDLNILLLPTDTAAPDESDPRSRQYRLRRQSGDIQLQRQDGAIQVFLGEDGDLQGYLGGDLPIQAQISGYLEPGDIQATISGITVDLTRVPIPPQLSDFSLEEGTLTGSLRVLGRPDDPDIFGTLLVENGRIRTPFSPDSAGPLAPALIFEDKLIRITSVETQIGTARALVSADILLNRLALEQFRLNLEIPGETGVHIRDSFGPLAVDGYARGTLLIEATSQVVAVSGDVVTYGTEMSLDPDFEEEEELQTALVVDVNVRTGRAVRFIWPDTDFPILRSNFATGQQIAILADTREDSFSVQGKVEIQSGDVFYFDRNFLIRDGEIDFQETQDDFDPRLTARAEIREVTPDGPVRIYLVADGQRLSEFSPRFESNPPLVGTDIVAVLGGNILQSGGTGPVNIQSALVSTSDFITQFGFFRQFENSVRSTLDLDLFAIRTSFIQNILLTAINPLDEDIPPLAPSLGTYLNNTSIFMGRYLGDSVFGQFVLQMRARDEYMAPGTIARNDGIQSLGGVLIDAEISLEWQTPFFLLEWNFAPQNPEELFIRDNTFSFLWSFSY